MSALPAHIRPGMRRGLAAWGGVALIAGAMAAAATGAVLQWKWQSEENTLLAERLAGLDRHRPDLRQLESRLSALQAADPASTGYEPGPDPAQASLSFAADMQQVLAGLGASVAMSRELPPVDDGPVTALRVELAGTAASSSLAAMVAAVEARPALTLVEALEVSRSGPELIAVRLLLRRYWARPR